METREEQFRIITIDDNDAIHADFRKILCGTESSSTHSLASIEDVIFDDPKCTPRKSTPKFLVDSAMQGEEGYQLVKKAAEAGNNYSVAFVDMRMPPGWDGLETIQKLWEADDNLQVVICTAFADHSWDEVHRTLGNTDRLLILKKPFDVAEVSQMAATLSKKWRLGQSFRIRMEDLENTVNQRTAELKQLAMQDRLTGLPNRMMVQDRLTRALDLCNRNANYRVAVLFLDFDRFKYVNDSLGHDYGDMLLNSIAKRLNATLRKSDTIGRSDGDGVTAGRLGGDEFIVILEGLRDHGDALRVADRLLEVLGEPHFLNGIEVHSTASIGITTTAQSYTRGEDMIRDADTAMYRAKLAGKARYVVFDEKMHEDAVLRLSLENDLRKAVGTSQLSLAYQPILSINNQKCIGFEALLRWNHPLRGSISPAEFIPIAEETRLIIPIGAWVIQEAARQLAEWQKQFPDIEMSMNINVSRKQLVAADLIPLLKKTLDETGIRPEQLKLEITESSIMQNRQQGIELLKEIRQMGFQLYMDDFGTGYSSLACLHQFPLDGIKIDRSFIREAGERRDYAAVVNAIVTLAHNLHMLVVAEGVENEGQLGLLHSLDCDYVQGYLFARPIPVNEVQAFLIAPRTTKFALAA